MGALVFRVCGLSARISGGQRCMTPTFQVVIAMVPTRNRARWPSSLRWRSGACPWSFGHGESLAHRVWRLVAVDNFWLGARRWVRCVGYCGVMFCLYVWVCGDGHLAFGGLAVWRCASASVWAVVALVGRSLVRARVSGSSSRHSSCSFSPRLLAERKASQPALFAGAHRDAEFVAIGAQPKLLAPCTPGVMRSSGFQLLSCLGDLRRQSWLLLERLAASWPSCGRQEVSGGPRLLHTCRGQGRYLPNHLNSLAGATCQGVRWVCHTFISGLRALHCARPRHMGCLDLARGAWGMGRAYLARLPSRYDCLMY